MFDGLMGRTGMMSIGANGWRSKKTGHAMQHAFLELARICVAQNECVPTTYPVGVF